LAQSPSAPIAGLPAPIRAIIGDTDVEAAYAVQEQITERRISEGARLAERPQNRY
jgi:2-keto-4-pentenoate hydratase